MQEAWVQRLQCPETGGPYDLEATRRAGDDVVEGFLVSRSGRAVRPLVGGVAVLVPDLRQHLRDHGHVYWRTPIADSRLVRFVLGQCGRGTDDFVPFDEVVARYGDLLAPPATPGPLEPEDAALTRLVERRAPDRGIGLDVGCGVGRSTFVLARRLTAALGVDRSAARIRRARNVAVTRSAFFVPAPAGSGARELPLDLDRLGREGADFAVASGERLPLAPASADVVAWRPGDGRGPWARPPAALEEACRVLVRGGLLLIRGETSPPGPGWSEVDREEPFGAWSRS